MRKVLFTALLLATFVTLLPLGCITTPQMLGQTAKDRDQSGGAGKYKTLEDAARYGTPESISKLTAQGADVNVRDTFWGFTPLLVAVDAKKLENANALLDKGADVNLGDVVGATPLHYAAARDQKDMADLFLSRGANPAAVDEFGRTPAEYAMLTEHHEIGRMLIDRGAPPITELTLASGVNWREVKSMVDAFDDTTLNGNIARIAPATDLPVMAPSGKRDTGPALGFQIPAIPQQPVVFKVELLVRGKTITCIPTVTFVARSGERTVSVSSVQSPQITLQDGAEIQEIEFPCPSGSDNQSFSGSGEFYFYLQT